MAENPSMVQDANRSRLSRFLLRAPSLPLGLVALFVFKPILIKLKQLLFYLSLLRRGPQHVAIMVLRNLILIRRKLREITFYKCVAVYKSYWHLMQALSGNEQIDLPALKNLINAFVPLLRVACFHGQVSHLRKLKKELQDERFLLFTSPDQLEYILSRVSRESWWDIKGSKLLMIHMKMSKKSSIVLLKYGYQYRFDKRYFFSHCYKIYIRLQLYGIEMPEAILDKLLTQANLRFQMALEILIGVFYEQDSSDYDKAILSLMWKTVPHPFISSTEMLELMSPVFTVFPQEELRDLCEEYAICNTVFAVPEVTSPRSLRHLSRVQVRDSLLNAYRLSDVAIDSFDIPCNLKSYLKLDSY